MTKEPTVPNPPELQEDKHGHEHHETERTATRFIYAALAALILWTVLFFIIMPFPTR